MLLEQYHVSLPEIVRVGRTIANEAVLPITASSPGWMKFTGAWGEAQYIQIPTQQAPLAYGTSPTGPAAHALWRSPLPTVMAGLAADRPTPGGGSGNLAQPSFKPLQKPRICSGSSRTLIGFSR